MKRRQCSKCGHRKPVAEFYKQATATDGYHSWCKTCSDANRTKNLQKKKRRRKVAVPATKVCAKCKTRKPASRFSQDKARTDGLYSYCKECKAAMTRSYNEKNREDVRGRQRARNKTPQGRRATRSNNLKAKFGISVQEFDQRFRAQDRCCAICKRRRKTKEKSFALDHNHSTGSLRGILCHSCNRALGLADENTRLLRAAIKYLERHSQGNTSTA